MKIAVVPEDNCLTVFDLKHPRTRENSKFAISTSTNLVYEVCQINGNQEHSLFYGDSVVRDGCILVFSPVDPVFLLLSLMEDQCKSQFVKLSDLPSIPKPFLDACPKFALKICDSLDASSSPADLLIRLNEQKVEEWLKSKFKYAVTHLDMQSVNQFKKMSTHALILSMFAEYISQPWYNKLKESVTPEESELEECTEENCIGFNIDYNLMQNPDKKSSVNNTSASMPKKPTTLKRKDKAATKNNKLITNFFKPKPS